MSSVVSHPRQQLSTPPSGGSARPMLPYVHSVQVDAQEVLETFAIEEGIRRYRSALSEEGLSGVSAGDQLIKAAVKPMEEALRAWFATARAGIGARSAGVLHYLDQWDADVLAWVSASAIIQHLASGPSLSSLATSLASTLEASENFDAVAKAEPRLAKKISRNLSRMTHLGNKLVFLRKAGKLADVKVIQWTVSTRTRVGTLLVALFEEATGLIALENVRRSATKTVTMVRATEPCLKWLEAAHARCELLTPLRLPMVCRPRDWTGPFNGGYLAKNLRQPIIKTRNRAYLSELKEWDMPYVYEAVNVLQRTQWSVNTFVYDTMQALMLAGRQDGGLPAAEEFPLPATPWAEGETPDPETLTTWKREAGKVYAAREKNRSHRVQLQMCLWVAEKMIEQGNRFFFVYNMDWRGRLYPVSSGLNPQGDDISKGLLTFTYRHPLGSDGAYWLAVHLANSFGVDKVSFEDRVAWVLAHEEQIVACGRDPLLETFWAEADSPFVFLAACGEYTRLQEWVEQGHDQEAFMSSLPVGFDGSCNGLQNFSAMLLDEVGGKATGLVPAGVPADVYDDVRKAGQQIIDKEASEGHPVAIKWASGGERVLTRDLTKQNTMTVPYGVTKIGMRDQLYRKLEDLPGALRAASASYLADVNYRAIGDVVVAARAAMDWLREAAKVAASNGLPVRWTTPVGLLVMQDYREVVGETIDFVLFGKRRCVTVSRDGDKLNTRKQALGISPNFVHSLDAAHLMRTVLYSHDEGIKDFAMVHDSYGVHAGHATKLRDCLREAFVEQYTEPVLANFRDQLASQLPPEKAAEIPELPPMGTLDLEQVKQSEYFFA